MLDPLNSGYNRPIFSKCARKIDLVLNPKRVTSTESSYKADLVSFKKDNSSVLAIDKIPESRKKKDFFIRTKKKSPPNLKTSTIFDQKFKKQQQEIDLKDIEKMFYNSSFIKINRKSKKKTHKNRYEAPNWSDKKNATIQRYRSKSFTYKRGKSKEAASILSGGKAIFKNLSQKKSRTQSLKPVRRTRMRKRDTNYSQLKFLREYGNVYDLKKYQEKKQEIKMEVFLDYKLGLSASKFSNSLSFFKSKDPRIKNGLKKYRLRKLKNKARKLEVDF